MPFPTDLQIARGASLKPIEDIAAQMGIGGHLIEPYGRDVAKIRLEAMPGLGATPAAHRIDIDENGEITGLS